MQIETGQIDEYVKLNRPAADEESRRPIVTFLTDAMERGERATENTRVALAGDGRMIAAIDLAPVGGGVVQLHTLVVRADASEEERSVAAALVAEAVDVAIAGGAKRICSRVHDRAAFREYDEALGSTGFQRIGRRVEFRQKVELLPDDDGTPVVWRTMEEVGREAVLRLFDRVIEGDPSWLPADTPGSLLDEWLGDPAFSPSPDCVGTGFIDGEPAALVIAQVAGDGWSRIAYLGLAPEYRGRGLGRWVHRHGFTMLREHGGRLYHGGTHEANLPMIALFLSHGCSESSRMTEWELRL